jgi:hypothetical protein
MLCGSQEGGLRVFRLKLTEYEASSLPRANISMEEFAAWPIKKAGLAGRKENAFPSGGY